MIDKLSNSPLDLVEFKIWWHIYNHEELKNISSLIGKFFRQTVDEFPIMNEPESDNNPFELVFESYNKFSKEGSEFPYIKLGKKQFSYCSHKENYVWDEFSKDALHKTNLLFEILEELIQPDHFHLELNYSNFIRNTKNIHLTDYLSKNLNFNMTGPILSDNPNAIKLDLGFKKEYGKRVVQIKSEKKGLHLNLFSKSNKVDPDIETIKSWITEVHSDLSTLFKDMTKGILYESFN